jgi:hypothetical protein
MTPQSAESAQKFSTRHPTASPHRAESARLLKPVRLRAERLSFVESLASLATSGDFRNSSPNPDFLLAFGALP